MDTALLTGRNTYRKMEHPKGFLREDLHLPKIATILPKQIHMT
jgi:hypothetical protein